MMKNLSFNYGGTFVVVATDAVQKALKVLKPYLVRGL